MGLRKNIAPTIYSLLASSKFFYTCLGLFTLGALWIALSSIYPMAFDEEFHYGLIKIYATSWLPYGIQHTSDMAQYGAATGDPSYLFHYLMSFPYRLFHSLNLSDNTIIVLLRFINIGFVVGALILFKKALRTGGIGKITANLSMLLFMLVPVFSMLAGQINYDNLLLLVVAAIILFTVVITNRVLAKKDFPAKEIWYVFILLLFGMPIKYAFLPIAAGIAIWIIGLAVVSHKKFKVSLATQIRRFIKATKALTSSIKIKLVALGVLGIFFSFHYVTNYVHYGSPIPACDAVFDEDACTAYGPWNRNRMYEATRDDSFKPLSLPAYITNEWVPGMSERLTFAVAGKTNGFQTKKPLPVLYYGFSVLTILGVLLLVLRIIRQRSTTKPLIWLTLLLCGLYSSVLIIQLYKDYIDTGVPVAINGRYLLLLLPLFGAVLVDSFAYYRKRIPANLAVIGIVAVIALFAVSGGGVGTYIVQSEPHWFWPGFGQSSHDVLSHIWNVFTIH